MFLHTVEFSRDELNGNDEKRNTFFFLFFYTAASFVWRFIYICIYLFIHYYMRQSFGSLNIYAFIYLFITMICVNMDHHLLFKDVLYSNCFAVKSL